MYAKSSLHLTERITEFDAWNRESVEQRQRSMAKLAVSAWRFQ
ncbi:hypothetical protein [Pontibacter sp. HJ8]